MKKSTSPTILSLIKISTAVLVLSTGAVHAQQISKFRTIPLNAGMHVITAEVAANEAERQQGLMFRQSMGPNEGMVFIFPAPAQVCMWMKNTPLPLSVAFLDDRGEIVNIENMQPHTTDSHCARKEVRYALEMNLDWFKKKGLKPGARIDGLPPVR